MTLKLSRKSLLKEGTEKIYIIYHRSDTDGKCGGAIIRYYCENILGKTPNMIPMDYGDNTDWADSINEGDGIYIVDFSLPKKMMDFFNKNNDLYWFDHHISAIEELKDLDIKGDRTTEIAGCMIAYNALLKHYIESKSTQVIKYNVNRIMNLISDYDNWNEDKYKNNTFKTIVSAFSLYINVEDNQPNKDIGYNHWVEMLENGTIYDKTIDEAIALGQLIQKYLIKINSEKMKNEAFEIKFENNNAIMAFNCKGSQSFDSIYDPKIHDMMITVSIKNDKTYSISLYGTGDKLDLSKIAKKYKGGGHFNACGFACEDIDFSGKVLKIINPI